MPVDSIDPEDAITLPWTSDMPADSTITGVIDVPDRGSWI